METSLQLARLLLGEDVSEERLTEIITNAFSFDVPVIQLSDRIYALELYHGPTLSFKDFGARFMARLMSHLNEGSEMELVVLVATSGDTGSAVAHGFLNVKGTRVVLLYPSGKVSEIQEKQLTTAGANITALEVQGTFDDCQRLVKQSFMDPDLRKCLRLTSANSINVARLIPQCFYYFYAWTKVEAKDSCVIFSVPSGNYGNLTAGLLAKKMGLPVARFVAASNSNDVIPEYLRTGWFRPRPSVQTLSNAMDVGNPSNFARMLCLYETVDEMRTAVYGSSYSDEEARFAIRELFEKYRYLAEPHGAIGYLGLKSYLTEYSNAPAGIFLETAHPAKFPEIVSGLLGAQVEMPAQLKPAFSKQKQSVLISSRYDEFKSFLLQIG